MVSIASRAAKPPKAKSSYLKNLFERASQDVKLQSQILYSSVCDSPRIIAIPAVLLCILIALGVWGVVTANNNDTAISKVRHWRRVHPRVHVPLSGARS